MKTSTPKQPGHRLMWKIYAIGWVVYAAFLATADQLDQVVAGQPDLGKAALSFFGMLPSALLLALAWPLTGCLERRRARLSTIVAVHAFAALSFSLVSQGPFWLFFGANKPVVWYIWPLLYHCMTYLLGAGVFHLIRAGDTAHRHALAMQETQRLLIASELNALRSKLNPHFLFNTLHSIIALTRKDPDAAETALFQFSDMLRYVLDTEKSGSDRVTLDAELDFVRDYLELEALRLGGRLNVQWQLDPDAGSEQVPALSLQPLVENSIKHAFNPHSRPGTLHIQTVRDDAAGRLRFAVRDDGPGVEADAIRRSAGLGLRTVEKRLVLDYGAESALRIDTAPGAGFAVAFSIPLETTGKPA
ncbi:sensor histidine kinase [Massilia sp. DD77]|uniref:sensor histidine kinase n=1 Tax=Massilia sp. DD77 TaxID=3109349 RepID=UPI002FFEA1B2